MNDPLKIMLVEDDPDILKIAGLALREVGGMAVYSCTSGRAALEALADFTPDLILLDIMMPHMDGTETFAKLREIPANKDTPVIFMTAKSQEQELKEVRSSGAMGVINKPFDPMTLADQVREIYNDR